MLATKLLCYYEWYRQGIHRKVFNTDHLRVLIETHSQQRMDNLITDAALNTVRSANGMAKGSGIFWFTTENNISIEKPDKILEPVWTIGHIRYLMEKHSIVKI